MNQVVFVFPSFFHIYYKKQLHINPDNWGSVIDRSSFQNFRENYWKERTKDFEKVVKNAK